MIVAIKTENGWVIRLDSKKLGHRLIFESIKNVPETELVENLKELYKDYGYYRP